MLTNRNQGSIIRNIILMLMKEELRIEKNTINY